MESFENINVGERFIFDGEVYTKMSTFMSRSDAGQWIASDTLKNPFAEPEMVQRA